MGGAVTVGAVGSASAATKPPARKSAVSPDNAVRLGFDNVVIKLATRPEKFGGTIERTKWSYNQGTMILAGDVGGTKTLIGLFENDAKRPVAVDVRTFPTAQYAGLPAIITAFLGAHPSRPALIPSTGVGRAILTSHHAAAVANTSRKFQKLSERCE